MSCRRLAVVALLLARQSLAAQSADAARVHELVDGLTVTPRVLIMGARPDDAPAELIAWLARGKHVQTAYLSLTRGESAPNYAGLETGTALGAVHVKEMLAARAIDGGEQLFTMAYDFGGARNAGEAYQQWNHDSLLVDVVEVIRAYRPQVIVLLHALDSTEADGQHQVVARLGREAFALATDTVTYASSKFGLPWATSALFEPGPEFTVEASGYSRDLVASWEEIGMRSRSQLRSFGFFDVAPWSHDGRLSLRRVLPQPGATSLFDGVDTTMMRLAPALAADVRPLLQSIQQNADSARIVLAQGGTGASLRYIAGVVDAASTVRGRVLACRHPSADAATPALYNQCRASLLDADASIDLVLRRATEALRIASGVTVTALADREFVAKGDSALVTVTVGNHGASPIVLSDVGITGARAARLERTFTIPPDSSVRITRYVRDLASAHPWWVNGKKDNRFESIIGSPDGVEKGLVYQPTAVPGVGVPENIRRLSDVTIYARIARTPIATSVGPILFRMADPMVGQQDRPLSAVPAVTLAFERSLEWMRARVPVDRSLVLTVRNRSDTSHSFSTRTVGIKGLKVDSLPATVTLARGEQREITLRLHGTVDTARYEFGVGGASGRDIYADGVRTAQYTYLTPVHLFRSSGLYLRAVDVNFPPTLSVAYVRGANEDIPASLKQLGIPSVVFRADELRRLDIGNVSTIVLGPRAIDKEPELLFQAKRLRDWVRRGGTLLIMDNPKAFGTELLPFPVPAPSAPTEDVMLPGAPVSALDAGARVLSWPNTIDARDWNDWAGPRALGVPATVGKGWSRVLRMADPGERPNDNTLLVASAGKGTVIYTTLLLPQQIANGVPGAMRLLVNLVSASAIRAPR